jgi:hypothetical protein
MDQLKIQALNLLQVALGGILSVAGIYATIYINKAVALAKAKAEQIKDAQAKAIADNAIDKTDNLITMNIIAAENTLKPAILKAIADGKVDKTEIKSLSTVVKENTIKQLGDGTYKILNDFLGDTNGYLENRIEKILAELKSAPGTEVNKTFIVEPTVTDIKETEVKDTGAVPQNPITPSDSQGPQNPDSVTPDKVVE